MVIRNSFALTCCTMALIAGQAHAHTIAAPTPQAAAGTGNTATAATPAEAQSSTAGAPFGAESTHSDDIVVTARRRSENIEKVPISIIAVTGATLKNQGIADLKQFSSFVPGVSINNGRPDGGGTTAQIFIRGVGQNDFLIPNEPGVGLYVDDVYVSSSSGALNSLGDIASIEVLRGPQGTLYGKNTIGGAIRITTVKPDLDILSGAGSISVGSYHKIDLAAGLNIPLGGNAALRVSGISRHTDDLQKRYLDPNGDGQGNIGQDAGRAVFELMGWMPPSSGIV